MTNRELSQVIRKDLKEHGITSKDVSVRVRDALYDTSVNITIKNPLIRESATTYLNFNHPAILSFSGSFETIRDKSSFS